MYTYIKNMKLKNIFYLFLAALLFVACKSQQLPQQKKDVSTVPHVNKPLTHYVETDTLYSFDYLTANFNLEAQGISANGVMRMKRDSIIWLTINKLVELGRVKLTPDSVYGYLKVGNKYVACTYTDLKNKMGVDIDFNTIQRILIGKGSNKKIVQVEYDNFDTIKGEEFPHHMDITLNDKRFYSNAKVNYTKIILDQPGSFPFSIPKSASRLWPSK